MNKFLWSLFQKDEQTDKTHVDHEETIVALSTSSSTTTATDTTTTNMLFCNDEDEADQSDSIVDYQNDCHSHHPPQDDDGGYETRNNQKNRQHDYDVVVPPRDDNEGLLDNDGKQNEIEMSPWRYGSSSSLTSCTSSSCPSSHDLAWEDDDNQQQQYQQHLEELPILGDDPSRKFETTTKEPSNDNNSWKPISRGGWASNLFFLLGSGLYVFLAIRDEQQLFESDMNDDEDDENDEAIMSIDFLFDTQLQLTPSMVLPVIAAWCYIGDAAIQISQLPSAQASGHRLLSATTTTLRRRQHAMATTTSNTSRCGISSMLELWIGITFGLGALLRFISVLAQNVQPILDKDDDELQKHISHWYFLSNSLCILSVHVYLLNATLFLGRKHLLCNTRSNNRWSLVVWSWFDHPKNGGYRPSSAPVLTTRSSSSSSLSNLDTSSEVSFVWDSTLPTMATIMETIGDGLFLAGTVIDVLLMYMMLWYKHNDQYNSMNRREEDSSDPSFTSVYATVPTNMETLGTTTLAQVIVQGNFVSPILWFIDALLYIIADCCKGTMDETVVSASSDDDDDDGDDDSNHDEDGDADKDNYDMFDEYLTETTEKESCLSISKETFSSRWCWSSRRSASSRNGEDSVVEEHECRSLANDIVMLSQEQESACYESNSQARMERH